MARGGSASLAQLNEQARQELQADPQFSEAYTQISTFYSNLDRLPTDQREKILGQIQKQANAQVDSAFDTEENFIRQLQDIKKRNIQDQLATFKQKEGVDLTKILGELSRTAGETGRQNFAAIAANNALETGTLGSFADRLVEELSRKQTEERTASDLAIKQAEQEAAANTTLTDMTAEEKLFIGEDSLFARRETARAQRYAELLGLQADADLLFQTPTALNTTQRGTSSSTAAGYLPSRVPTSLRSATNPVSYGYAPSRAEQLKSFTAQRRQTRLNNLLGSF